MEKSLNPMRTPEKMSAKELTEAIEKATDLATWRAREAQVQRQGQPQGQEFEREQSPGQRLGQEQVDRADTMRGLGQTARFAEETQGAGALQDAGRLQGAERSQDTEALRSIEMTEVNDGADRVSVSNDDVKRIVAIENGYEVSENLTPGEGVVGGESTVEIKERLKSDEDTAKIQSGEGLSKDQLWMHEISAKSGKKLANEVEKGVAEITDGADFNPNTLEKARFRWMLSAIQQDEGYKFGERN